ncbi:ABC transporter C family member 3-like protein [Tanacetum coccineum]
MVDFVPGRAVTEAAQRKRVKYEAKCADIRYGFLPFPFSSFEELEKDAVTLLKRIRKFSMAQDIGARVAVYIFNMISFFIAKGVGAQIVSRLPSNLLVDIIARTVFSSRLLLHWLYAERLARAPVVTELLDATGLELGPDRVHLNQQASVNSDSNILTLANVAAPGKRLYCDFDLCVVSNSDGVSLMCGFNGESIDFTQDMLLNNDTMMQDIKPNVTGMQQPVRPSSVVNVSILDNLSQARLMNNGVSMRIPSIDGNLYSSIPSEPPLVIESNRPNDQWPSQGEVDIRHLQEEPVVGSQLSLFRLVEPAAGQILIDGVNISTIGLHDLRSRLSIIPQDPTMFEGTIRSNLDPLEEYTDDKIWEDTCSHFTQTVTENGENWKVGQRQLVCLGRVLLKKNKVLVLDEATASVDTATDGMIQQTLNRHFNDSTVIMIGSYSITSVLDSDMVLVLEQGLIEEYDSPTKLLEDKSSSFAKLVAEYSMRSNVPDASTFDKGVKEGGNSEVALEDLELRDVDYPIH